MLTRKIFFGAIAFVAATILTNVKEAEAANRFAMSEVMNKTNQPIRYSIRWGTTGRWHQMYIAPGKSLIHNFRYQVVNRPYSPTLYIRFDEDLSYNNRFRTLYLQRNAGPEVSSRYSKKFKFVKDGPSGKFLDLLSVNY